jgi:uncharacterized Zn finger protein
MPINSKKYLITNETHEVFVVRKETNTSLIFCTECGKIVEMLDLPTATTQTTIRTREIIYLLNNGEIHSVETDKGQLLICKNSLSEIYK